MMSDIYKKSPNEMIQVNHELMYMISKEWLIRKDSLSLESMNRILK